MSRKLVPKCSWPLLYLSFSFHYYSLLFMVNLWHQILAPSSNLTWLRHNAIDGSLPPPPPHTQEKWITRISLINGGLITPSCNSGRMQCLYMRNIDKFILGHRGKIQMKFDWYISQHILIFLSEITCHIISSCLVLFLHRERRYSAHLLGSLNHILILFARKTTCLPSISKNFSLYPVVSLWIPLLMIW